MATYHTSDPHFGHKFVAGLRGFTNVDDHDEKIASAFNVLGPDDIVWVQGDICVSASGWARALEILKSCPGRKRLISGNHDPVANHHRDSWKFQRAALEVFECVQEYGRLKLAPRDSPYGGYVLMSHYPYLGAGADHVGEEARYPQYRLPDMGMPMIHGHTHGTERLHFSDAKTPQIHVGLDAWNLELVPQHDIVKLLDSVYTPATVGA
jgi:calcineurin-like phosphoesterase family protein